MAVNNLSTFCWRCIIISRWIRFWSGHRFVERGIEEHARCTEARIQRTNNTISTLETYPLGSNNFSSCCGRFLRPCLTTLAMRFCVFLLHVFFFNLQQIEQRICLVSTLPIRPVFAIDQKKISILSFAASETMTQMNSVNTSCVSLE